MKRFIFTIMMVLSGLATMMAQTVAVNSSSVVITNGALGNVIMPLSECYFAYKTTDSTFQVFNANNVKVFDQDCASLTTETGDTTTAMKIARLATYCQQARVTATWYYYLPKGGNVGYTVTNKKVRIKNGNIDFTFNIDSLSGGGNTAARLAYLKSTFNKSANLELLSAGSAATVAAGAAAGSSPTVAVSGNGVAGTITITTGTTATTGALATVTLPVTFPNGLTAVLTPGDADAAASAAKIFVTSSAANSFVVNVGTAALSDATEYIWHYTVIGD